ncbi:uncharacterized protein LOC120427029 [Culex pipiens pallens]|uniref:uncharacterized protein LOC120427029 n=1 Tax=Culex pipiens pallens TaxID=42434 RepID=UPI0019538A0E|nr:uncharacterized protein LOC120427029 [Culex pipiens pallens]
MVLKLIIFIFLAVLAFVNADPAPPTPPPINDLIVQYAQRLQQQLNDIVNMSSAPAQVKEAIRQKYSGQLTDCQTAAQETDIMGFVRCTTRVIEEANVALWSY